ncbi:unnamed protein product [Caenorhabditis sp. 36 PRJEB53466]|nr:unnamed protein product [Caenorhabditis sp. 36 PRJEB53466]
MLPLPWWILGTAPFDEEEQIDRTVEECIPNLEIQESMPSTPISLFRTPHSTPFAEASDELPKIVNLSTFLKVAKRRSSTTMESGTPKLKKTVKRPSAENKTRNSFERKETEVMNKTNDGLSLINLNDTLRFFNSESPRAESPILSNKINDSFENVSILNHTNPSFEENENAKNEEEQSSLEFPPRNYPMFFTSFNDTTVVFNTTISGDFDAGQNEKNAEVENWVFKGNKFLDESRQKKTPGRSVFKEPVKNQTVSLKNQKVLPRSKLENATMKSDQPSTSSHCQETTETPSASRKPVALERRQTPSRKAKTYKSLKGMF